LLVDEGTPEDATLGEALYWTEIYAEILVMEEAVLDRIHTLVRNDSAQGSRRVELTNVQSVVDQAEGFRVRHGNWSDRVSKLKRAVQRGPEPISG
jgi:hypothetical protein